MERGSEIIKILEILERDERVKQAPVFSLKKIEANNPFKILVSAILSTRTKDTVTISVIQKLFSRISSPQDLLEIDEEELSELIYPIGFYRVKAKKLKELGVVLVEKFGGQVPSSFEKLMELPGVGRKVANIVLAEAFHIDTVAVDTHVHRISNLLGIVKTRRPEETEEALKKIVPKEYWKKINKILVGFGQTICVPKNPKCNECPVNSFCSFYNEK